MSANDAAGDETSTQDVIQNLDTIQASLSELQQYLKPLLKQNISHISEQISNLDNANLYAALAYSLHALFFGMFACSLDDKKEEEEEGRMVSYSFIHSFIRLTTPFHSLFENARCIDKLTSNHERTGL